MAKRNTHLDRGASSRENPVFWGFALEIYHRGKKPRLRWRWGRICGTLAVMGLLGYVAFSSSLYLYFKVHRQFEEVKLTQVLTWPINRSGFRQSMGEYFIERGKEELAAYRFSEAFYFLRAGVARSPENLEARVLLAELFEHGMRRHDLAVEVLQRGIRHTGKDLDYLRTLLAMMMRNELDYEIIQFANEQLSPAIEPKGIEGADGEAAPERRWEDTLAFFAAKAHFYRGNYDLSEEFLRQHRLTETPEGIHLRALIHWSRGHQIEAIALLEDGLRIYRNHDRFLVELSRFYRERGEMDSARRYGVLRAINNPDNPMPRIELLYAFDQMGDRQRLEAELESLLRKYSEQERVLLVIGEFAAETGDAELAQHLYATALEKQFEVSRFLMLILEAHIVAGNYGQATALAEEIAVERPNWLQQRQATFNSLRAIAYFGSNRRDLGQLYLNQLYTADSMRVDTLMAVSRRLGKIGFDDKAVEVLNSAYLRNPRNQAALSALIEAKLNQDMPEVLPQLVQELLQMRRPSPLLLKKVHEELGRDRYFFDPENRKILRALRNALQSMR